MSAQQDEPRQVLKFEAVQERLQVSRSTLFRLMKNGDIPSFKIERSTRFLAEDVDAYIRERRDAGAR